MNTLEKLYVYNISKKDQQLYDLHTASLNPAFSTLGCCDA